MQLFTPPKQFRRRKLSYVIQTVLVSTFVVPSMALAQDSDQSDSEIEEVIVTGSFLRNSAFAQDTAMDTVSGEDFLQSGAPTMDQFIRTLSYVQNVNVQNIVLGGGSGPQTGRGAEINLRGLGANSTLTLVNGTRTLNPVTDSAFPAIAMERMETVLDGGSALYGSDAVAGVVNLIPIKQYDGIRFRSFYQRPEEGGYDEQRYSALFGRSFDNNVNYVGAAEHWRRSALMMYERPREFGASGTMSSSGNPGTFRRLEGASDAPNVGEPFAQQGHGGEAVGPRLLDPNCGTFNEGRNQRAIERPHPSGTVNSANYCTFDYGSQASYLPDQETYTLYNNVEWQATPGLRLEATLHNYHRRGDTAGTFTSPNAPNNLQALKVPAEHPANPYGHDVVPDRWRVFTHPPQDTLPDHVRSDTASVTKEGYWLNRGTLRADYEISGSWRGTTLYSKQRDKDTSETAGVHTRKLQLAVHGLGGPSGDQWFNPFGSYDPRAPGYVEGVTNNTKEMNNWLFYRNNHKNSENHLDIFETVVSGEAFDAPIGLPVLVAFGYHWRELEQREFQEPYDAAGDNFVWGQIDAEPWFENTFDNEIRAVFAEVEVPVLPGFDVKAAVRHEELKKRGLETTVPKVSARYEVSSDLSLRASWGESFLAPDAFDTREARNNENCGDMFSGRDPISGELLIGGLRCSTGNPDLQPETADILNVGFTWQPGGSLSGLEFSADYQTIDYTDRIRTLSEDDVVQSQFQTMLAETGLSAANYDPTPGSATRQQADLWLQQNEEGRFPVTRNPDSGAVERVLIQSANVATYNIEVMDAKLGYNFTSGNLGTFDASLNFSLFTEYKYSGGSEEFNDALGKQNALTGAVPPLPKTKASFQGNWFRDNKSASISATWFSSIIRDNQIVNLFENEPPLDPSDKIGNRPLVNAIYTHSFYDPFNFDTGEIDLSIGVNNLFDEKPQLTGQIGGFESRLINNFYRQWQVSLEWRPGT